MKAIKYAHASYENGYDFSEYGKELHTVDNADAYEVDEAILLCTEAKRPKYTVLFASGCSCWDGDYDGWTDLTKAELIKLAKGWAKQPKKYWDQTDRDMGIWILENFK